MVNKMPAIAFFAKDIGCSVLEIYILTVNNMVEPVFDAYGVPNISSIDNMNI
jgi:hypothetical protein